MAIQLDEDNCIGCGCCTDACTEGALELRHTVIIFEETCVECGECIALCPSVALSLDANGTTGNSSPGDRNAIAQ